MAYKHFCVSISALELCEDELNRFLQSHRILSVEKRWVKDGGKRVLVYVVEYWVGKAKEAEKTESKEAVEYRKIMTKQEFALFSRLKAKRKELASKAEVKLYQVCGNDQLMAIVKEKVLTKSDLAKIPGVGESRVEQFGDEILDAIKTFWEGK